VYEYYEGIVREVRKTFQKEFILRQIFQEVDISVNSVRSLRKRISHRLTDEEICQTKEGCKTSSTNLSNQRIWFKLNEILRIHSCHWKMLYVTLGLLFLLPLFQAFKKWILKERNLPWILMREITQGRWI